MKHFVAILIIVTVSFIIINAVKDDSAMEICQRKYSYGTCADSIYN